MSLLSIIKVGPKGSEVKFNNVKMLRAISNNDVERLLASHNTSFLVFEGLNNSDTLTFIDGLVTSGKIKGEQVYLYNCEIEQDKYSSYSELKAMQKDISFKYMTNVRTYVQGVQQEIDEHNEQIRLAEEKARLEREEKERQQREEQERQRAEQERLAKERAEAEKAEQAEQQASETSIDDLFDDTEETEQTQAVENSTEEASEFTSTEEKSENTESELENKENTTENKDEEQEENKIETVEEEKLPDIRARVSLVKEKTAEEIAKEELTKALASSIENRDTREAEEELKERERVREKSVSVRTIGVDNQEFIWNPASEEDTEQKDIVDTAEVKELRDSLALKDKRIAITEERITRLTQIRDSLQDRIAFYENLIARLEKTANVIDISTKDSDETLAKLNEYKLTVKQLEGKLVELQQQLSKIDELNKVITDKDSEIAGLKDDLQQARTDDKYREISVKLDFEEATRLQVLSLLEAVVDKYNDTLENYENLQGEARTLKDTNIKLTRQLSNLETSISDMKADYDSKLRSGSETNRQLRLKLDDFNKTLRDKNNALEAALKEKEEALNNSTAAKLEAESANASLTDIKSQLRTANAELNFQVKENDDLKEKLKKFETLDIEKMQDDLKISEMGSSQTLSELGRARQELQSVRYELKQRDDTIARLNEEKSRLEIKSKSLARTSSSAARFNFDVQYSGKASIIAVFGTGSYGVTTTAVSIAKKLPGNVLLMDMDCVNPKIDAWVGMNPMIKTLDGLSGTNQSAFSALINKGVDYVIERRDQIFRRVAMRSSGSGLFYFSGIYTPIDLSMFVGIDFNQFLNFFGNEFQYIVVDLGHIGSNENQGALIRMFNSIAWRNVFVCMHNKNDLRSAYIKSKAENIAYTKTIWLLNMAENTKIDDSMNKILGNMKYQIMQRDFDNFGSVRTYSEWNRNSKGILETIVKDVTC